MLVGYLLLAPPLFLLGPLLILLLLSRPASPREWLWVVLTALAAVVLANPARGGFGSPVVASGAAFLSGAFAIVSHLRRDASTLNRSMIAAGAATLTVLAWAAATGLQIATIDAAVLADLHVAIDLWFKDSPPATREAAAASVGAFVQVYPAIIALFATAGAALAWLWYHQVAREPIGRPPSWFRDLRFNDHLVWGAIFTLAAALLPLGETMNRIVLNGLVVWSGLYAARGLAIAITIAARWPLVARLLLLGLAVLALPFAGATLVTLGLVDTWLDFRGRLAPPPSGGNA
jgi:hypothetical protein